MTSAFVRDCAPGASRAARTALGLFCVTSITACTRVDAASAPMRSADIPSVASFDPPPGTYDAVRAQRGKVHFDENCARCHVKQRRTESAPARPYVRLRQLGRDTAFFADGSARTLEDVVDHYDQMLQMRLSKSQRNDLVEYLKSH